jgi:hypothetical protein
MIRAKAPEFIRTYEYTKNTGLQETTKPGDNRQPEDSFKRRFQKTCDKLAAVLKKR